MSEKAREFWIKNKCILIDAELDRIKKRSTPMFFFSDPKGREEISKNGFKTAEDAARAYDETNRELHGEFGIRNFED